MKEIYVFELIFFFVHIILFLLSHYIYLNIDKFKHKKPPKNNFFKFIYAMSLLYILGLWLFVWSIIYLITFRNPKKIFMRNE